MGGMVIETVRPGVQFIPDAAAAFRRANAQVRLEFGRDIDVNSTYRDWDLQLRMYNAWIAYVNGRGPYPGHSKALHPNDPLAFHTKGTALDSDDWRNARIVQILADNGFIRNRLYVANENHHFEWLKSRDRNYGTPIPGGAATATPPPRPPSGDEPMYIQALTSGKFAQKGNVYVNDIQGHWRGITNLEFEAVKKLMGSGLAVITEFDGTDLDLMFAVAGVWEQPQIDSNTAPRWGKAPGTPLMGLGALTGRLLYPGQPEGWHYPRTAQAPGVDLSNDADASS